MVILYVCIITFLCLYNKCSASFLDFLTSSSSSQYHLQSVMFKYFHGSGGTTKYKITKLHNNIIRTDNCGFTVYITLLQHYYNLKNQEVIQSAVVIMCHIDKYWNVMYYKVLNLLVFSTDHVLG